MTTRKLRAIPYLIALLPLDIVVGVSLLLSALFAPRPRNHPVDAKMLKSFRATIQILNWDGKHLLAEGIPSVLEAIRFSGGEHRVLVVDNGSTDGSAQFVRERFPQVAVLELDRNYGFVGGNNKGVERVETEVVVLLNNDMVVEPNFLKPLLDGFTDESVFAVTSQVFLADTSRRREETGKTRAVFEGGFFRLWHADIEAADEARATLPVFWAGGGACAFDRAKYCEVGGLDDLYHPFYVEDTDLSYQAWKRGWKCLLAPASRVIHKHRATSSRKYSHDFVDNTIRRNLFLFVWKNVTDFSSVLDHVLNLPRIHGKAILHTSGMTEVSVYSRAVVRFPSALRRRIHCWDGYRFSDREVLLRSQQ